MENRKRASRATAQQYKLMLDFFEKNKCFPASKYAVHHGRRLAANKWEQLATLLNGVRTRGAEKTAAQWQVVWRDFKSRTCVKARQLRKQMKTSGGKFLFTELERRVLGIIGVEFQQEKEENPQISFELVDLGELEEISKEPIPVEVKNLVQEIDILDYMTEVQEQTNMPKEKEEEPQNAKPAPSLNKMPKNESCDCFKNYFSNVVKQQAESAMVQADAAKQLAEAAKQQAEATMQHAKAILSQAQAYDRLASVLEQLTVYLKEKFLKN